MNLDEGVPLNIEMNRLSKNFTLSVTMVLTRQFRVRIAIALFLIKLAAEILGCGIEIEQEAE